MVPRGAWVKDRQGGMPDFDEHVSLELPTFVGADPQVVRRARGPARAVRSEQP